LNQLERNVRGLHQHAWKCYLEELVLDIFRYLPDGSLAQLCLVNKRCGRIAEECLYSQVELAKGIPKNVSTLAADVRLIKHLKRLPVAYCDPEIYDETTTVIKAAKTLRYLDIHHRLPENEDMDQCPYPKFFQDAVSIPSHPDTNTFEHLHTLHIYSEEHTDIEDIAPVFQLPALVELHLSVFFGGASTKDLALKASSSNIRRLELDYSYMTSSVVVEILRSIKVLETFKYECGLLGEALDSIWADGNWRAIGKALQQHKDTLRKLELRDHVRGSYWTTEVRNVGILGSLQAFGQLKQLTVPAETLLKFSEEESNLAQQLPPGLEELHLCFDRPHISEAHLYHQALTSLVNGVFTGTNRLVYVSGYGRFNEERYRLEAAFEILEQAGINVDTIIRTYLRKLKLADL
jgi:hypothetical protein